MCKSESRLHMKEDGGVVMVCMENIANLQNLEV
jgi:hypothetical protein